MKFRYIVETINKNGMAESSVKDFNKSEIVIGRGTSADVLLMNRLVSLTHAKVTLQSDALFIQDLDSLSGVLVNGNLIQREKLKPGDKVKIGSFLFEVFGEQGVWGFLEKRREVTEVKDTDTILTEQYKKLRFQSYLPSFTILSSALSVAVLGLFLIAPLFGFNKMSWNSGPISNAHRMLENDCKSCHASPFKRVRDEQCVACHAMSDHAKNIPAVFNKHPELNLRCASCHMEHNGDAGIIARASSLCTSCHAKLDKVLPGTNSKNIPSFAHHPELRVTIREQLADKPVEVIKKVPIGDKKQLSDPTAIKLNHKIHLEKDLAGATGPVTMQCSDCHQLTKDFRNIQAINFESHCASCHGLEFDSALPGKSVPHSEPDTVYNFLYAEYAKLFLVKQGLEEESVLQQRRKPGQAAARTPEIEFSRQSVEAQSRSVEESLFTRTACHLCHMVNDLQESSTPEGVQRISRYSVVPPKIPDVWMPSSTFDHGAHQEIACESCHVGVRESKETKDVLLPGLDNCKQCHQQETRTGMVKSECVMCHSYHDPLLLKEDKKREIEKVLLSFNGTGSFVEAGGGLEQMFAEKLIPLSEDLIPALRTGLASVNAMESHRSKP